MAYISTKCSSSQGRHCDCVTGPWLQSGGVRRPNTGTNEHCSCKCHYVSGDMREWFDKMKMDNVQVHYHLRSLAQR